MALRKTFCTPKCILTTGMAGMLQQQQRNITINPTIVTINRKQALTLMTQIFYTASALFYFYISALTINFRIKRKTQTKKKKQNDR